MPVEITKPTLEIDGANGVQCEKCKEEKDEAVSIETTLGNVKVSFILCQECITDAIATAVNDEEPTTIEGDA